MTQSDWESIGALIGLFIVAVSVIWVILKQNDDYFDGGW